MDVNSDIKFKNDNPGAVKFGNFINYYQFHSAENRIKLLPTNIWKTNEENNLVCLDIGCNAGDLTSLLLQFFEKILGNKIECKFLGLDVDPTLIQRAKESNKYPNKIEFLCIDFMNNEQAKTIEQYLQAFNKRKFNITFCLSITMWIHLNHGDDGLKLFIEKVCDISDLVVIEPQPWKCYKTAVKRLKQANSNFPLFKQIVHRHKVEEFIESVLQKCKFLKIYESPRTDWGRKMLFYERK